LRVLRIVIAQILMCVVAVGCSPALKEPTQAFLAVLMRASAEPNPTEHQLDSARQVVDTRLSILLDPNPEVSVSDGGLLVVIVDTPEARELIKTSIEPGYYRFLDSESSLPIGSISPMDANVILTSDDITRAEAILTTAGGWQIDLEFDDRGRSALAQYSTRNLGHYLILTKDNEVVASLHPEIPVLDGRATIVGIDQPLVRIIAAQLESGSLPDGLTLTVEP